MIAGKFESLFAYLTGNKKRRTLRLVESKAEFSITYDGPALAGHKMDTQVLGPALLAIGSLCQESHRAITGTNANIKVFVRATGEGSFDILLQLIAEQVPAIFEDKNLTAQQIMALLGLGATGGAAGVWGLLDLLQWKRGRRIENEEKVADGQGNTVTQITVPGDNNTVNVDNRVTILLHDDSVRKAQSELLNPLRVNGVTTFRTKDNDNQIAKEVKEDEVLNGYFDVVPDEVGAAQNPIPTQMLEALLLLHAPVFKKGPKWQFIYGEQRVYASILDEDFNKKVFEDGARFGVGDCFRVRLSITQTIKENGKIHNDYEIIAVTEIIPIPKHQQRPLDL